MTKDRAPSGADIAPELQAFLDASLPPVAVLDRAGDVIAANDAWRQEIRLHGACRIGQNYLTWSEHNCEDYCGRMLTRGIAEVLSGMQRSYEQVCTGSVSRVSVRQIEGCAPPRFLVSQEASHAASLTDIEDRLLLVQVEERQRLARELHDTVGQNLVGLNFMLDRVRSELPREGGAAATLQDMSATLDRTLVQIRTLSFLLQPPWDEGDGNVETALHELAVGFGRRADVQTELRLHRLRSHLSRGPQLTLYRVLQEALVNVHRHARAKTVKVELEERGAHVVLKVSDDGAGSGEGDRLKPGAGIKSMRHRLRSFGGDLVIVSNRHGTRVTAKLPIEAVAA